MAGGNSSSQWIILALSLLVTTVVGYVNFMNPAQRWQQLRGKSIIFIVSKRHLRLTYTEFHCIDIVLMLIFLFQGRR